MQMLIHVFVFYLILNWYHLLTTGLPDVLYYYIWVREAFLFIVGNLFPAHV